MAGTLGTLFVLPRYQGMYQGVFAPGALLYFYEAGGTSTPLNTYTTQALSVANANPVVADAYGLFGPIYLLDRAYSVVLKTSAGVTIWSQDNVRPYSVPALNRVDPAVCDGRLTLSSGTPVTTSDVTAATTVYFTPYKGNQIALYDSTYGWDVFSFTELSIALGTDAASLPYDVFAVQTAGVVTIERLAWSNDTTRATGLALQNGVLVKSGDATRRYLGTYRTTSTIGQTEDSLTKRFVSNYYNRARRRLAVFEATNTWTYTTATWRQANGSTANQVEAVIGVAEVMVALKLQAAFSNTNAGVNAVVAIKQDATSGNPAVTTQFGAVTSPVANYIASLVSVLEGYPAIGYHFWSWNEYSAAGVGTTTFYGDNGAADAGPNSGMVGWIDG